LLLQLGTTFFKLLVYLQKKLPLISNLWHCSSQARGRIKSRRRWYRRTKETTYRGKDNKSPLSFCFV
jgi:hypothetical protein